MLERIAELEELRERHCMAMTAVAVVDGIVADRELLIERMETSISFWWMWLLY